MKFVTRLPIPMLSPGRPRTRSHLHTGNPFILGCIHCPAFADVNTHWHFTKIVCQHQKILVYAMYHLPLRSHLCHVSLMKNFHYLLLLSCFSPLGNSLRHVGSALSDRAVITSRDCYDTITTQTNNA